MKIKIALPGVQTICTEHGMVKAWDICFNCDGDGKDPMAKSEGIGAQCDICDGRGFVEHCPACLYEKEHSEKHPERKV